MVQIWGPTARAATLHRHLRRRVASLHALGRWETARVLLAEMRDARGELTPGVRASGGASGGASGSGSGSGGSGSTRPGVAV